MKKSLFFLLVLMNGFIDIHANNSDVYPTNWWVGMKTNSIQLLIRSTGASFSTDKVSINYPGITILKTHQFQNKKYLAVDIIITPETMPGDVIIELNQKGEKQKRRRMVRARKAYSADSSPG